MISDLILPNFICRKKIIYSQSCPLLLLRLHVDDGSTNLMLFIIHPFDPTVVICYLIWPCDIAVCITYLISHSYSITYNLRIFQFGCIINTKLPSCDDIIRRTSLGFPSWCSESTPPTDSCFQAPAVKTSRCTADYINTLGWFCICTSLPLMLSIK